VACCTDGLWTVDIHEILYHWISSWIQQYWNKTGWDKNTVQLLDNFLWANIESRKCNAFTDLGPKFIKINVVQSSIGLSMCKHTISYICIYMLYCDCLTLVDGDCTSSSYRKLWSNNKSSIKYFKLCAYFLKTLHYYAGLTGDWISETVFHTHPVL